MGRRLVGLAAAAAVLALTAGCGGKESHAVSTEGVSAAGLVGTWAEPNGPLIVRFTPDGKFAIDGDGSLKDGEYANGKYTVEGSRARFFAVIGPRGCGGQEWEWEMSLRKNGTLHAKLLQEVCEVKAGTRWALVKRPDS